MERDLNTRLRQLIDHVEQRPMVYRRIEDASGNLGTFDTHIVIGGHAIWCELKETETPGAKPDMRRGQPAFGRKILKAGGTATVLVSNKRDSLVRIIRGDTTGDDWQDKLIYHGLLDLTAWRHIIGEHTCHSSKDRAETPAADRD